MSGQTTVWSTDQKPTWLVQPFSVSTLPENVAKASGLPLVQDPFHLSSS